MASNCSAAQTKLLRPKLCLPFWLMAKNPHDQIGPRFAPASVFCLASALAPNHMAKLQTCRPGVAQSRLRCCIISYNLCASEVKVQAELQMGPSIGWLHLQASSANGRVAIVGCQRSNCKLPDMQMRHFRGS